MTDRILLSPADVSSELESLPGWEQTGDRIRAEFTFGDFAAAMAFMVEVGIHADKMNHHPEWSNVYNRVTVELTTHDDGGVTNQDIHLARIMNRVANL